MSHLTEVSTAADVATARAAFDRAARDHEKGVISTAEWLAVFAEWDRLWAVKYAREQVWPRPARSNWTGD